MELPAEIYDMIINNIDHAPTWLNMLCANRYIYDIVDIRGRIRARERFLTSTQIAHDCGHAARCKIGNSGRYYFDNIKRACRRGDNGLILEAGRIRMIALLDGNSCNCSTLTTCSNCNYIYCESCKVECGECSDSYDCDTTCPACNIIVELEDDDICTTCLESKYRWSEAGYCHKCKKFVNKYSDCDEYVSDSDTSDSDSSDTSDSDTSDSDTADVLSQHEFNNSLETMISVLCDLYPARRDLIAQLHALESSS